MSQVRNAGTSCDRVRRDGRSVVAEEHARAGASADEAEGSSADCRSRDSDAAGEACTRSRIKGGF